MTQIDGTIPPKYPISEDDVLDYLKRNEGKPLKIITTYESLFKIIAKEWVVPNEFNLLIDEYHCLIREYVFRNKGVINVLTWFRDFASYTFMSATPVFEEDYVLEELKEIPVVTANWDTEERFNVTLNFCKDGFLTPIVRLINRYLNGEIEGNLYLFVNSLQIIKKIVGHPEIDGALTPQNTKLIASKNSIRQLPFDGGELNDGIYKKINMLTSTAFEAVDIDDEIGRAVIVADSRLDYTLFDTSTILVQVLGRLRKSPYKNEIEIYVKSKSRQTELPYEVYKGMLFDEKERIEKAFERLRQIPVNEVERTLKSTFYDYGFIKYEGNQMTFDNNHLKYQLWKYRITHWIFNSDVDLEHNILSSNIKFSIVKKEVLRIKDKTSKENLGHFKFCVEKFIELSCKSDFLNPKFAFGNKYRGLNEEDKVFVEKALLRFPYIIRAINEIGLSKIRKMGFNTSNIQRKLIGTSNIAHHNKIREILGLRKLKGKFLPTKDVKSLLGDIYRQLDIPKRAKGTDIKEYFNIVAKKRKNIRGYLIGDLKKIRE